ncbi:hypothetical protein BN137_3010 [Cronobacter condimenti 1330]|uniref:Uncharacterized protein n=1 Tax=Cronobacter condimenti 1330 TaxID=1073999 RepID=K8A255_9ENTR|nr:hypothetical protein BN137_3010 [Cronobacter condimenti 1330]
MRYRHANCTRFLRLLRLAFCGTRLLAAAALPAPLSDTVVP